jgi:spermidine synthase
MENSRVRGSGAILILFALSGMAALIYEIVWYQLLQLAIGATAISLGVLLASFMGGLCLGAGLFARLKTRAHPLYLYAVIELAIGAFGLLVLWILPLLDKVYFAAVAAGMPSLLLRGVLAALCLLPPTILMGASLPAIVRFAGRGPTTWAWLYAANTLGAMAGALLAAFVLLRLYDIAVASYAAAAINLVVAAGSWWLARHAPLEDAALEDVAPAAADPARLAIYFTIALSGLTALGAEVVWTRLLGMLFAGTAYAFATILAVFLGGMALGSFLSAPILKRVRPALALGLCQLLLAAAIGWAAYCMSELLPKMPALYSTDGWRVAGGDFLRAAYALFPATLLWGASFPFAMAAIRGGADPAKPVGRIYAANTLGGIAGALLVSLVMIVAVGTQNTERLLLALTAMGGVLLLAREIKSMNTHILGSAIGLTGAASLCALLLWTVPALPPSVVAYGPDASIYSQELRSLALVEGINSTVAIDNRNDDNITEISVAGHVEASNQIDDMRLQRMVGHLPALLHPNPKKILGIGFGAGVSAGSFTRYPSVTSITVCEIEPAIPPTSSRFFAKDDNNVYRDPRTRIVFDDARHYMMTTKETYDIIASDPLDVWVKGTASIYTQEFFEKVRDHLNPGGYFTLYVPLYQADQAVIKSELATFFKVFPNATVWANTQQGGLGYDMVAMGQKDPLKIDISQIQKRLLNPEYMPVLVSLNQIGFTSASDLYGTFAAQRSDLAKWLGDAQVNTDRNLRLMYLAGWSYNADQANALYQEILTQRKTPRNIFSGAPGDLAAVFGQMEVHAGTPADSRASGATE